MELFLPIDYCHSLAIFLEEELAVLVSDTVAVLVQLIHPARDQRSKRTDHIYENVWNHTENYGDELMNYGLITSDVTAGEVPGNVTPCTDFESRIYMLKGKKVQEGR